LSDFDLTEMRVDHMEGEKFSHFPSEEVNLTANGG